MCVDWRALRIRIERDPDYQRGANVLRKTN